MLKKQEISVYILVVFTGKTDTIYQNNQQKRCIAVIWTSNKQNKMNL
eukprot:UN09046